MSAIARFTILSKEKLDGLRESAIPIKRMIGKPVDKYWNFLNSNGEEICDYQWSGYVLATLLPYLAETHNVDLMGSDYDALSGFLSEIRSATHFIFTKAHKDSFLKKLEGEYSEIELEKYFNEFNETNEEGIGKAMIDGIKAFHECLSRVDDDNVIIFSIS